MGIEFLLEKNIGKTTGWLGYTLSWADRQFEDLNFGQKFPARYDRRHDVSAVLTHEFSKRVDIGLTWVYGTGNATTLGIQEYPSYVPQGQYNNYYGGGMPGIGGNTSGESITYYGGRNQYRMPAYHRMDIGVNFHKQKKHGIRTWSVSAYNAYSRQNPFYIYWGSEETGGKTEEGFLQWKPALKQVSLFPFIPSVSYTFKF